MTWQEKQDELEAIRDRIAKNIEFRWELLIAKVGSRKVSYSEIEKHIGPAENSMFEIERKLYDHQTSPHSLCVGDSR